MQERVWTFLKWIQLRGIKEKQKSHFAQGSEIPWTHPRYGKRGKDPGDVKNLRDFPRGREVILMKWHLKTAFVLGARAQERCRHFLGKSSDEKSGRRVRGLEGPTSGDRLKEWSRFPLVRRRAKIGLDNHLQLLECINTKESKVLLGAEQRSVIISNFRQQKEILPRNNLCLQERLWQLCYTFWGFKGPTCHRCKLQNIVCYIEKKI